MKKILVSHKGKDKGKYFAIIDDADYEWLNQWKWSHRIDHKNSKIYAERTDRSGKKQKCIRMHCLIINTPKGMHTDHINGNSLDNRRSNLRICTPSQNQANRGTQKNNFSGYKGIIWHKQNKKWEARIGYKGESIYLGIYKDIKDAALAYNQAAQKYHKEFAYLNKVPD